MGSVVLLGLCSIPLIVDQTTQRLTIGEDQDYDEGAGESVSPKSWNSLTTADVLHTAPVRVTADQLGLCSQQAATKSMPSFEAVYAWSLIDDGLTHVIPPWEQSSCWNSNVVCHLSSAVHAAMVVYRVRIWMVWQLD